MCVHSKKKYAPVKEIFLCPISEFTMHPRKVKSKSAVYTLRLNGTEIYWGGPLIPKFISKYGQA